MRTEVTGALRPRDGPASRTWPQALCLALAARRRVRLVVRKLPRTLPQADTRGLALLPNSVSLL